MTGAGHNGGPPLEEPARAPGGTCLRYRHRRPPDPGEVRRYEGWFLTGRGRRVREPSGACDRMLLRPGAVPAHCGTKARTAACCNFAPAHPTPARIAPAPGGAWVTVWQDGRAAWAGREEHLPERFRAEEREAAHRAARGSLLD